MASSYGLKHHTKVRNMSTVCLFTLNSAEVYIYCVRIRRFKAWPISAPAYFSPCMTVTTKVQTIFLIRCWFQNMLSDCFAVVLTWQSIWQKLKEFYINTSPPYVVLIASVFQSVCLSVCVGESDRNLILTSVPGYDKIVTSSNELEYLPDLSLRCQYCQIQFLLQFNICCKFLANCWHDFYVDCIWDA